jgi:hypothetical protein
VTQSDTTFSPHEQRVANWLLARTNSALGGGEDPVGFVLASYEHLHQKLEAALNLLARREMSCAGCCGSRATPDQYPLYLKQARDDVAQAVNYDVAGDAIPYINRHHQL